MAGTRNYQTISLSGTTDAAGAAVVSSAGGISGEVLGVLIDQQGSLPDTADVTLAAVFTGAAAALATTILTNNDAGNIDSIPLAVRRTAVTSAGGTNYIFAGTDGVPVPYPLINSALRVTIANGGDTKTFGVHVLVRA